MFRGIGTGCKLSVYCSLHEHICIGDKRIQIIDGKVKIILDLVEITVVRIGNLRGQISLGYTVDIVCSNVERTDDGIKCLVDAFNDLLIIALMFRGIGTGCEFSVYCGLHEHIRIINECIQIIDGKVQVVLDFIKVAIIRVGNLRGQISLGNTVDIVCSNVERSDDGVQSLVDAFNDLMVTALEF